MIATRRTAASGAPVAGATGSATGASGDMRSCADAEVEKIEHLPRAVAVGVLVEDALARPATHLLGLRGVVEQHPVGGNRLVGVGGHDQLAPRLEPALDPVVRIC